MAKIKDRTNAVVKTDLHLKLGTDPNLRIPAPRTDLRKAALTLIRGPGLGRTYPLSLRHGPYVIGRIPDASILIVEPTVSREHASVEVSRGLNGHSEVRIRDRGGRNGTYVNGHVVNDAVLEPGDKIQLGDVILRFDLLDELDLAYQETIAEKVSEADLDPQTGLYSKRFYLKELPQRVDEWLDLRLGYSLVFLDVDHFKSINDRLGHDTGDRVLADVGRVIRNEVRRADIAIRYGGDEVLLVLPGADEPEARVVASRVRMAVRTDITIEDTPKMPPITVSLGLATHQAGEGLDRVFERADAALLRAKTAGRDRMVCDGDDVR